VKTLEAVEEVLREVFDDPGLRVSATTTANDVDGWDSLSHVNVVVAVEARFGIRFTQREALTFRNVGEMVAAIEKRLGPGAP
jgi:acyl carrier protein